MTEANLRKALATIMGHEYNAELLPELYGDARSTRERLVERAVDELYSPELLKYVNACLKTIPAFSMEGEKFEKTVETYDRMFAREGLPMLPAIWNGRVCLVSSSLESSICCEGLTVDRFEESFICENGDALKMEHEMFEFDGTTNIYRKMDEMPDSLSEFVFVGLLPDRFKDFWE